MHRSEDFELDEPRPLTADERRIVDKMLQEPFNGRDELQTQLADSRVVALGPPDTRTIVFASPSADTPRANTESRVPVDAVMTDIDGVKIEILLHVIGGVARELESYRVDGRPIIRPSLDGPIILVNWKPPLGDDI